MSYEIIYPERTIKQKRNELKILIDPPLPSPEWKRYIKSMSDKELENYYNWLCIVGRIKGIRREL